jgi:hypothetical protein
LNGAGGIAQLGERLHGMQEVIGSIPFTSTKITLKKQWLKWRAVQDVAINSDDVFDEVPFV